MAQQEQSGGPYVRLMPEAGEGRERYYVQVRATFRTMRMGGFRRLFVAYLQVMCWDGIRLGTHSLYYYFSFVLQLREPQGSTQT